MRTSKEVFEFKGIVSEHYFYTDSQGVKHPHTDTSSLVLYIDGKPKGSYIIPNPTGNCQSCIYTYFNSALQYLKENNIDTFVNAVRVKTYKRQLIVDVNQSYLPQIKELFKNYSFIFETPYTSTNNSAMCILSINLTKKN